MVFPYTSSVGSHSTHMLQSQKSCTFSNKHIGELISDFPPSFQ